MEKEANTPSEAFRGLGRFHVTSFSLNMSGGNEYTGTVPLLVRHQIFLHNERCFAVSVGPDDAFLYRKCTSVFSRIDIMEQSGYDAVWLAEHHFSTYSVSFDQHDGNTHRRSHRTSTHRNGCFINTSTTP